MVYFWSTFHFTEDKWSHANKNLKNIYTVVNQDRYLQFT